MNDIFELEKVRKDYKEKSLRGADTGKCFK